jgi:PAS domain S-box-containing protein
MARDDAAAESEIERLRARVAELEAQMDGDHDEGFLRSLLSAVPAFIVRADHELKIQYINHIVPRLDKEEVLGKSMYHFIDPAFRATAQAAVEHTVATGEPSTYEVAGSGPNGSLRRYHSTVSRVSEPGKRPGVCVVATDITTLLDRELRLAKSEQVLRLAREATGLGLWSWDLETNEVTWDDRMFELTGLREPVPLGEYIERLVHPDDVEHVRGPSGNPMNGDFSATPHRIVRPDGETRWILTVGEILRDDSGQPTRIVGGLLDVTEQQQVEEQLRHAQKMEAVGNLTAGVAHNFNNMLMAVIPTLELLRDVVPQSHRDLLVDASDAAERGADMVRQLMTFSGQRRMSSPGNSDVGEIVRSVVSMCSRTFDRHIQLTCTVAAGPLEVRASPGELEAVLMNVILNARDAVSEAPLPAPRIAVVVERTSESGGTTSDAVVQVRVTDNGIGMDENTLRRACEPFFTTKPVGQGTGLGLSTSYAIMRGYGGSLEIESEPGEGTELTLRLGLVEPVVARASDSKGAQRRERGVRVLVIDDEPLIRKVIHQALTDHGFKVGTASEGKEALATIARETYDVLLLDLSLPDGPGAALIPSLRAHAPSARVIFFTGRDIDPDIRSLADGVIQKPVRIDELIDAIEAACADLEL